MDIEIGTIARRHNQPVVGRVKKHVLAHVPAGGARIVWLHTPASPFTVSAVVRDKIVPHDVDPSSGDVRTLGAQVSYRWSLTKGK